MITFLRQEWAALLFYVGVPALIITFTVLGVVTA